MMKNPVSTDNNAGVSPRAFSSALSRSDSNTSHEVTNAPARLNTNGFVPSVKRSERTTDNRNSKKKIPTNRANHAADLKSQDYNRIIRAHYASDLLRHLSAIQPHAGTLDASLYALRIFETVRQMEKEMPEDPLLHLIFALSDAMSFEDRWQTYTAVQYERARAVVEQAAKRDRYEFSHLADSLQSLEAAGFVTQPFAVEVDYQDTEVP